MQINGTYLPTTSLEDYEKLLKDLIKLSNGVNTIAVMLSGERMEVIYNEQFGVVHVMSSELARPLRKRDSQLVS